MSWRSLLASLGLVLGIACLASDPAHAVQADEVLPDPALEARARDISAGLRCLVCQNQSIDDSDAPLAKDLRLLVRERLTAGDSDREVVDFVVARYGEFVLLKPRLSRGDPAVVVRNPCRFRRGADPHRSRLSAEEGGSGQRRAAKCRREAPFEALAGRELRLALNNKGERLAEGRFSP